MALQIEQLLRFLGFLTIAVCHDLARTNLALPSRAARNRRSGLSSHPPSRGDLLGASVAAVLAPRAHNRRAKAQPDGPIGPFRRGRVGVEIAQGWLVGASRRCQDKRCPRVVRIPGCCRPPRGPHFGRSIGVAALGSQHWGRSIGVAALGSRHWRAHLRAFPPRVDRMAEGIAANLAVANRGGRAPSWLPSFGPCFGGHDLAR